MSDPYIGEIRMFGGNFAPAGWAFCDGSLVSIAENETLFNLIGTTYGGDGENTFALPDLQSRVPLHAGNSHILGETGGAEQVTLNIQELPAHSHPFTVSADPGGVTGPAGAVLGANPTIQLYRPGNPTASLRANSVTMVGGSRPHNNIQPYLAISFIISLYGIYPTQT